MWGSSPPQLTLMILQAPSYPVLYWSSVQYSDCCTTFIFTKNWLPEKNIKLFHSILHSMPAGYINPILCLYLLLFPLEFLSLIHWCLAIYFLLTCLEICRWNMLVTQIQLYKTANMLKCKICSNKALTPNLSPCFQRLFVCFQQCWKSVNKSGHFPFLRQLINSYNVKIPETQ